MLDISRPSSLLGRIHLSITNTVPKIWLKQNSDLVFLLLDTVTNEQLLAITSDHL